MAKVFLYFSPTKALIDLSAGLVSARMHTLLLSLEFACAMPGSLETTTDYVQRARQERTRTSEGVPHAFLVHRSRRL